MSWKNFNLKQFWEFPRTEHISQCWRWVNMTFQRWLMGPRWSVLSIKITPTHPKMGEKIMGFHYYLGSKSELAASNTLVSFLVLWSLTFNWLPSQHPVLIPSTICFNTPYPWKAAFEWAQLILSIKSWQWVSLNTAASFLQREAWVFIKGCRHMTMSDNYRIYFFHMI